jgi:hypothetical protein
MTRQCFYIPADQYDGNGYIPSLVTEGEPGHAPLTGNGPGASPWYWGKSYEQAQAVCTQENARLGISAEDAAQIVASSMTADGHTCQDAAYGPCPRPECGEAWR